MYFWGVHGFNSNNKNPLGVNLLIFFMTGIFSKQRFSHVSTLVSTGFDQSTVTPKKFSYPVMLPQQCQSLASDGQMTSHLEQNTSVHCGKPK